LHGPLKAYAITRCIPRPRRTAGAILAERKIATQDEEPCIRKLGTD
jgi:hypothetical protein